MNKKILIVDDESVNRTLLRRYLESEYDVIEAVDGEEAVCKIKEYSDELAIILLDIVMPKLDGFDVLEKMNYLNYIGEIPVILITADMHMSNEERAFDLGASDFIMKPFNPAVVLKRVENIVNLFERTKELRMMIEEQQMIILKQAEEIMGNEE